MDSHLRSALPVAQERSRRTAERILEATESLLETSFFEDITVARIARRARVAVGSVYRRFANKEALLPCLYERYADRLDALIDRELRPEDWAALSLAARVRRLVRLTVEHYSAQRGLLRAIVDPKRVVPEAARRPGTTRVLDVSYELLLACRDEIRHADARRAVILGFYMMYATARDRILYPGAPQFVRLRVSPKTLERELARSFLAYLTTPAG